MAALTTNRTGFWKVSDGGEKYFSFPVAADAVIFWGAMVSFNADGFLAPAADAAAFEGKKVYLATQACDNTGGANGAKRCECLIRGTVILDNDDAAPIAAAHRGTAAHVADDGHVANTSVNDITFGEILDVGTAGIYVKI